jgi:predicted nuclease of restriction endonuclease-like RecB superfamily
LYDIDFEFEPTVFAFPIKRGTKAYTPDFYIKEKNIWVEVKGFLDPKSKIKLKRFKRYYEKEFNNLVFVISKFNSDAKDFAKELGIKNIIFYEDIRSFYADKILNWEGK